MMTLAELHRIIEGIWEAELRAKEVFARERGIFYGARVTTESSRQAQVLAFYDVEWSGRIIATVRFFNKNGTLSDDVNTEPVLPVTIDQECGR